MIKNKKQKVYCTILSKHDVTNGIGLQLAKVIQGCYIIKNGGKLLYPLLQVILLVVVGQNDPAEQNNSLLLPTSAQIFAPPQVWFG